MKEIIDALEAAREAFANCPACGDRLAKIDAALAAARVQQPVAIKRYALNPDNGMMMPAERGPWVRYVDAAPPAQDAEDAARRLAEVREIYAGMEGFIPQTAAEGYCLEVIRKMAHAAIARE